jgi:hypothetical protein
MTDTGAYSDVMFGLFRHLGYRFCPRLADILLRLTPVFRPFATQTPTTTAMHNLGEPNCGVSPDKNAPDVRWPAVQFGPR